MITREKALSMDAIRLKNREQIPRPIYDIYILKVHEPIKAEDEEMRIYSDEYNRIDLVVSHEEFGIDSHKRYNGECDALFLGIEPGLDHISQPSFMMSFPVDGLPSLAEPDCYVYIRVHYNSWHVQYRQTDLR